MRLLFALILALAGCSTPLPITESQASSGAVTTVATSEPAPGTTEPCRSNDEVTATLDRFVAAFNSGDPSAIRATVSRYAEWFSVTLPSRQVAIYGQDEMVHHMFERAGAGDRFSAARIEVNGLVGWDGSAHFSVNAIQLTRDGRAIALLGKGALQCRGRGQGIIVLSLAAR